MPDVVKHEEDATPSPQGARLQRDLSPMGEACFRMDITAIHKILVDRQYRDDVELSEVYIFTRAFFIFLTFGRQTLPCIT